MNNKSIIYYFSATGNSYDIARKIAKGLENCELIPIARNYSYEHTASRIGFIFPVYYGTLPRLVKNFIRNLSITSGTYCFSIVTMGLWGSGSLTVLNELLMEKGLQLSYGKAIQMPRNYIVEYNVLSKNGVNRLIKKGDTVIEKVIIEIKHNVINNVKKIKFTSNKLYKNIEELDNSFYVNKDCIGCGLCVKICPVKNIKIKNIPEWQHHCEHCTACIHWCPQIAIQYGNKTLKRGRYHHPNVTADDLII